MTIKIRFNEEDRDKLDQFDTTELLSAVDHLDVIRAEVASNAVEPPAIRNQLLELHTQVFRVVNQDGDFSESPDIFDLAEEIQSAVFRIHESADKILDTLLALQEALPEPDYDYDE